MSNFLPDAASRMKIEKFRDLLDTTKGLEERDPKGRTALFRAARLGRTEHVALLIQRGADVNATDANGEAPLQATARYGHIECAELLVNAGSSLDYLPPPEMTNYSETALCSAVRKAPQLVKFLLSCGADPNAASAARRLPLIIAAKETKNLEMMRMLIDAGARVNEQDQRGRTALHAAIDAGSAPAIRILLEHGADPEVEAIDSGTALCTALLNFKADQACLVLSLLGAKPNLSANCPSWQMTPIELAQKFGLHEVAEILKLAGSPPPRVESQAGSGIIQIDTPDRQVNVQIRVGSPTVKPIPADVEIAKVVCGAGCSLFKRFGWQASNPHWEILLALAKQRNPIPITRIAYFARGYLNAPPGKELEDGPAILGESYHDAMQRFVDAGFVGISSVPETITLTHSTADLKSLAKKHGVKPGGTKHELIWRLVNQLGLNKIVESLQPEAHFLILPEGQSVLAARDHHLEHLKEQLRHELYDLLKDDEFAWSCHVGRDLGQLSMGTKIDPEQMGRRIALARISLTAPLPPDFEDFAHLEDRLRAIAAAVSLSGDHNDDYTLWDAGLQSVESTLGEPLTPTDFRLHLLIAADES